MKAIYKQAKKELESKGIDFNKDAYTLNSNDKKLLEKAAKKYGYRVSSCGNSSIGCVLSARFFMLLQNIKMQR